MIFPLNPPFIGDSPWLWRGPRSFPEGPANKVLEGPTWSSPIEWIARVFEMFSTWLQSKFLKGPTSCGWLQCSATIFKHYFWSSGYPATPKIVRAPLSGRVGDKNHIRCAKSWNLLQLILQMEFLEVFTTHTLQLVHPRSFLVGGD